MNNKTIGIITLAILVIGGYTVYQTKFWKNKLTVGQAINLIIAQQKHNNRAFLEKLDGGYIKSWGLAVYNGDKTFEYEGITYSSQGGTAVK